MKALPPYLLVISLWLLGTSAGKAQYVLREAYPSLSFDNLTELVSVEDGRNRMYTVSQNGVIYWFPATAETATQSQVFLDIQDRVVSGGEMGLLGLAFHPDFQNNGFFYVNYTAGSPLETRISRFSLSATDPERADPASEQILLTYLQPFENHNGGKIAFGPDGFLYISSGDGGSGGDPLNNGQNRETLLGKILRIDVNAASNNRPYAIPPDNPFRGNAQGYREEIYAYGLRNPWKFSFDLATGRLWAADVGQNNKEEINIIENGGNYGWRVMEGTSCYNPSQNCNTTGLILPVYEYSQSQGLGRSITGGYVYRGSSLPDLQGKYLYGDYVSGNIWALTLNEDGTAAQNTLLLNAGFLVSGFSQDQNQELLVLSHGSGRKIYRLADIVTGVAAAEPAAGVEVFPNPARTAITVRIEKNLLRQPVSLRLYNALGQALDPAYVPAGGEESDLTIDLNGVAKGIYTLQVAVGERLLWKKVVIQ
jgi:glucose/arabinose dehydrogenase